MIMILIGLGSGSTECQEIGHLVEWPRGALSPLTFAALSRRLNLIFVTFDSRSPSLAGGFSAARFLCLKSASKRKEDVEWISALHQLTDTCFIATQVLTDLHYRSSAPHHCFSSSSSYATHGSQPRLGHSPGRVRSWC